jgi:chitinase
MTMNFAGSAPPGTPMYEVSTGAIDATFRQVSDAYTRAGSALTEAAVWARMGATPMIGQNDVAGEVFTLDDARQLRDFADDRKLGRLSMWSANRDIACPGPMGTTPSNSCSGVAQEPSEFAKILSSASPRTSPGRG